MLRLTRTVRFSINPAPDAPGDAPARHGFGGVPSMRGLGRYYEIDAEITGQPDPTSGYLLNIKDIDRAVRASALPLLDRACRDQPDTDPQTLAPTLFRAVDDALGGQLTALRWRLTPYYQVEMTRDTPDAVLIRQRFDFAAAHRLHVPELSDERNRELFGKCNNPSGHGHNYMLEPVVAVRAPNGPPPFTLADLERLTIERVVDRFDHTHLNVDTPEFAPDSGVNPSVEHIARVCFDLLAPAVADASGGDAELRAITVWETDRTSCTYPA